MSVASGRCLCGAIRYAVDGPLRPVIACHCSQCRRTSGHHVAATAARSETVRVVGEPVWYVSSPGVRRGFCGICGSNLFWQGTDPNFLSIFAGTLDTPADIRLAGHIHAADKGDYYEISDGLPRGDCVAGILGPGSGWT
jgi:hypothetical protein